MTTTAVRHPPSQSDTVATREGPQADRRRHRHRLVVAVLIVGLVAMAAPFVWMLLGSLKTQAELTSQVPTWLPENPTSDNYRELLQRLDFPRYFWNSTIIAGLITVGNTLVSALIGYALAKIRFAGRSGLFAVIVGTLMVPSSVTLIPLFILISKLGLTNSYAGVVLPLLAGPFGVFLMRQFMQGLPDELIEAARVDGAGHWRIFSRIALPLAAAPMAVLGIFTFLSSWNAFLWPLIVLTDADLYTLPIALATFAIGEHSTDYGLLMAGAVAIVAPVIVVFLILQRRFTESIALTGIK